MTRQVACKVLAAKFPKCRFYVEVMQWVHGAGDQPDRPVFNVCVYEALGEGQNLSGSGDTLEVAVESLLAKAIDTEAEADAMFEAVEAT